MDKHTVSFRIVADRVTAPDTLAEALERDCRVPHVSPPLRDMGGHHHSPSYLLINPQASR